MDLDSNSNPYKLIHPNNKFRFQIPNPNFQIPNLPIQTYLYILFGTIDASIYVCGCVPYASIYMCTLCVCGPYANLKKG